MDPPVRRDIDKALPDDLNAPTFLERINEQNRPEDDKENIAGSDDAVDGRSRDLSWFTNDGLIYRINSKRTQNNYTNERTTNILIMGRLWVFPVKGIFALEYKKPSEIESSSYPQKFYYRRERRESNPRPVDQ